MEATLLDFVLDVAQVFLSDIAQHFAQDPLECVVLHGPTLWFAWRRDRRDAVVADVEGGAKQMAALAFGIPIVPLQASYIVFRPQDTRHDDLVQRDTFYI